MITHESDLTAFLNALAVREPGLSGRVRARLAVMRDELGVETVGELWGLLHPVPPPSGSPALCLRGFAGATTGAADRDTRVRRLAIALMLPIPVTRELADRLDTVPQPLQLQAPIDAEWHTGCLDRTRLRSGRDYHVVEVHERIDRAPRRERPALVPKLEDRLGPAWDQGRRGTCVAHAAGALFAYILRRPGFRFSLQFLYHQCKMIDGIPRQEGTYLETSMRVFSDRRISGPHLGWGAGDAGLPPESAWAYDPTYQPGNPGQSPPPPSTHRALYQGKRWGNLTGRVLRCSRRGKALVEDIRSLLFTARLPVVIGLPLYPSFNNANSRRTGRIPVPLPGERPVGGHAMLVVGADDQKQAFLVRNSWSPSWAPENPYGLPGHAVIPYRYFEIHGSNSYAVEWAESFRADVAEAHRLYRRGHRWFAPHASERPVYGGRGRSARHVPPTVRAGTFLGRLFG